MNHLNRRKYKNRSSIYSIDNKQTINKIAQVENDIAQWEWNEIPPENIAQYELHLSSNDIAVSRQYSAGIVVFGVYVVYWEPCWTTAVQYMW